MIHLLYGTPHQEDFAKTINKIEELSGNIYFLQDDYSVGPLNNLEFNKGNQRKFFWNLLKPYVVKSHSEQWVYPFLQDQETINTIRSKLSKNQEERLCFWFANNALEMSAYFYGLSLLESFHEQLYHIYIDNLPFFSEEKRVFFPKQINEIKLEELSKCVELVRKLSMAEIEMDIDTWNQVCDTSQEIRVLQGSKLLQETTYMYSIDDVIQQFFALQKKRCKVAKLLSNIKHSTGMYHDAFILWRLNLLVESGHLFITPSKSQLWSDHEVSCFARNQNDTHES